MKKIILLTAISLLMFSCSSDDDSDVCRCIGKFDYQHNETVADNGQVGVEGVSCETGEAVTSEGQTQLDNLAAGNYSITYKGCF